MKNRIIRHDGKRHLLKGMLWMLIVVTLLTGTGCSGVNFLSKGYAFKPESQPELSDKEAFVGDINQLGFKALNLIVSNQDGDENCMISPTSLATALSLVSIGADGQTREQINALINTAGLSPEQLGDRYYAFISGFFGRQDITVTLANSIWIRQGYRLKDSFLKTAKTSYNAEVANLDFKEAKAVKTINDWISNQTNGLIKNTLKQISEDAVTLLVNTLYFKGSWADDFSEKYTQKEDFTLSNGEVIQVDMMNKTSKSPYCRMDGLEAVRLPYNGGASMLFIRPEGDVDELLAGMTADKMNQIIAQFEMSETDIKVPKFAFSSKNTMADYLKSMGMTEAFSNEADFSGMIEDATVKINEVIHDCRIELDEEGTIAAAVTVIEQNATSAKPEKIEKKSFYLDKPFVFAIIDSYSGAVLFLGKVENPNAQ